MIDIEQAFGEDASDIQYRLLATEFEMANGYSMRISNIVNQFIKSLNNGEHLFVVMNPDTGDIESLHLHKYGMFIILDDRKLVELYRKMTKGLSEEETKLQIGTFNVNYADTKADGQHLFMDACFYEHTGEDYKPLGIPESLEIITRLIELEGTDQISRYMKFNLIAKEPIGFNKETYMGIVT